MNNYDFSTLSSEDLEELVCDLLNAEEFESSIQYKTFKAGKDQGIDFLYSTEENKHLHVGQVKHFYRSGYSKLFNEFKTKELPNVINLKPKKYIIGTSVDLSVSQSKELLSLLSPYLISLNDIYGKKDLNRLIGEYDNVHNRHFKLWFSSAIILNKILESNLEYRSVHFNEYNLKRKISLYVETKSLQLSRTKLSNHNYLIITGEPGVGKTTLSEMLCYEYLKEDYELSYIYNIKEIEKEWKGKKVKQIFYFDDFLGSTEVEINRARGSDNYLNQILSRIAKSENKYIILTTRKHILQAALQKSEKLNRFKKLDDELIVELKDYNIDIKRSIFINHIEFSEMADDYKEMLLSPTIIDFVIKHKHFAPRSIEYITSKSICEEIEKSKFISFVRQSFNSPSQIWEYAYLHQLEDNDRILLNTLLSFGLETTYAELNRAYDSRIQYEVEFNNKSSTIHSFKLAYKRLLGGFLYSDNYNNVSFINNSLPDFLLDFVRSDRSEVVKIASSATHINQLKSRLYPLGGANKLGMPQLLKNRLLTSYQEFLTESNDERDYAILAVIIYNNIDSRESKEKVIEIIDNISDWDIFTEEYELKDSFMHFLENAKNEPEIKAVIDKKLLEVATPLITSEFDFYKSIETLTDLIKLNELDPAEIDTREIKSHFEDILQSELVFEIDFLTSTILDESEADEIRRVIEEKADEVCELGIEVDIDYSYYRSFEWQTLAFENYIGVRMLKDN